MIARVVQPGRIIFCMLIMCCAVLPAWTAAINQQPTLNAISDINILEDSGLQGVSLTGITDGGDSPAQTLTITATSNNTTLLLNPTVVYTSPATTGTLLIAPIANQFGTAMVTVTVKDNGGTAGGAIDVTTRTFTVTVLPINDRPLINNLADVNITENDGLQTINFSGVNSGPSNESGQNLSIAAVSSNPSLIPNPAVTYISPNATGSLAFTPVANKSGTATIIVTVSDDGGTTNGGVDVTFIAFDVVVQAVPHTPFIVTNAGLTLNRSTSSVISRSLLEVDDYGPANQLIYSLVIAPTKGELRLDGVVLAANDTFTQADINAGLLVYRHTGTIDELDSFDFTVTNAEMNSLSQTTFSITVSGAGTLTIPVVTLPSGGATWIQGSGPVILDNAATVADASGTLVGGTLTVTIITNAGANDVLSIRNVGTNAGQIGVSGSVITYGGSTIGTASGGSGGSPLVVDLSGTATPTAVQALVRNLRFNNIGPSPSNATRTIEVVVENINGGVSAPVTTDMLMQPINQAPVVAFPSISVAYLEASGPIVLDATATVSDPDSPSMAGGVVTITWTANATANDNLAIRDEGMGVNQISVSGSAISYNGSQIATSSGGTSGTAMTLTLTAAASPDAVQAMLRNLTYDNQSLTPSLLLRELTATVTDGAGGTSNAAPLTVVVQSTDNPPVVTLPSPPLTWVEGTGKQVVDAAATVTDVDSAAFDTGLLVVEFTGGAEANDQLSIESVGAGSGQIDVVGTDARYEGTIIGDITGPGTLGSSLIIRLNANATVAATQALLRHVAFENVAVSPLEGVRTVRIYLSDGNGGTSLPVNTTITVQSVNVAPTVALPTGSASWTEHDPAALIDAVATITDSDSSTFNGGVMSVSMTDAVAGDVLSIRNVGVGAGQVSLNGNSVLVSGVVVGTFAGGNDTTPLTILFSAQSTPAAAQSILRAVQFNHVGQFTTIETRAVAVSVSDGVDTSADANTTINLTPVDDPPTVSTITLVTVEDIPVKGLLPGSDPEMGTLTFELVSTPTNGVLTLDDANTGAVTYVPATGITTDDTFSFRVSDGVTWSSPVTAFIKITGPLANVRPLIISAPPREGVIGATYTYVMSIDVGALPPGADLRYQIVNPPAGATATVTKTTATTATISWDQTGAANVHRQLGILVSDAITGTASYQTVQVLWLAVAPATSG